VLAFGGDFGPCIAPCDRPDFLLAQKLRKPCRGHLRDGGARFPPCLASIDRRPTTAGCVEVRTAVPEHGGRLLDSSTAPPCATHESGPHMQWTARAGAWNSAGYPGCQASSDWRKRLTPSELVEQGRYRVRDSWAARTQYPQRGGMQCVIRQTSTSKW